MDWDEDNEDELVVGSDDFSIRVFKTEGNLIILIIYVYRVNIWNKWVIKDIIYKVNSSLNIWICIKQWSIWSI